MERLGTRLDAVGVSLGPGGFTGLRIAVSAAKMLAETLGLVTIGVPSALVVAEWCDGDGPILVALASKRDTVWMTRLVRNPYGWSIDGTPQLAGPDLALTDERIVLADRHLPHAVRARITSAGVIIVEPRFEAEACLRVAERLHASGHATDPARLAPIYPRPPEAVRRRAARE
jgi:tRNA threonylcarbamoyl adenosine modification protein YeaZ